MITFPQQTKSRKLSLCQPEKVNTRLHIGGERKEKSKRNM